MANLEDNLCLTECENRALTMLRFKMHTGLKKKHFELHHGRKQRTELKNVIEDGESFLSEWSKLSVSNESKSKIPIYVSRNSDGDYI